MILLSIPWAVSIHTVTAFLYSGLPGRPLWLTAILAPRFLASAFASGPALLILLCLLIARLTRFAAGREAIQKLAHHRHLRHGHQRVLRPDGVLHGVLQPHSRNTWSRCGTCSSAWKGTRGWRRGCGPPCPGRRLAGPAARAAVSPQRASCSPWRAAWCFVSLWIDKGIGLIVAGFVPSPLGAVTEYAPTLPEILIVLAIWAIGSLILTVLYKIALSVREAPRFLRVPAASGGAHVKPKLGGGWVAVCLG